MPIYTYPNRELPGSPEALRRPRMSGIAAQVSEGFAYTTGAFGVRAYNMWDASNQGEPLDKDAIMQFQQENGLDFGSIPERGYTMRQLELMRDQRRASERRQRIINEAQLGGASRFMWGLVGGLPDPINLLFLPAGLVGGGAKTVGTRVALGAVEGIGVSAVYEGLRYPASKYLNEDYSFAEAGLNLVLSAGFGGAIGGVFGRRSNPNVNEIDNLIPELRPQDRQQIGQIAIAQALNGDPINVTPAMARAARRRAASELLDPETQTNLRNLADNLDGRVPGRRVAPHSALKYETSRVNFRNEFGRDFIETTDDPWMSPELLDSIDVNSIFPRTLEQARVRSLPIIEENAFRPASTKEAPGPKTGGEEGKGTSLAAVAQQDGPLAKEAQEALDIDEGAIDDLFANLDDDARIDFEEGLEAVEAYIKDTEGFTNAVVAAVNCGRTRGLN